MIWNLYIYTEEVRDPSPSYPYKRKFVEVVGYKNNEKDIFGEIYNAGLTFIFSIHIVKIDISK